MTIALPVVAANRMSAVWQRHLVTLAIVAGALLLPFHTDLADLAHIWWTSTTFGHCLFIGPVVAWLVWQRRGELAQLAPVAWWPALAIVAAGGAAWLMGDAGSVSFARHLGLAVMLQGAVVTILGPSVARGIAFPLGYALFLVPAGEGLQSPLQSVTAHMVVPMLHVSGIPASLDGVMIHGGHYYFEVAEACSGAKFVIAMIAFGALVANVCFTTWTRRAVFLAVCVVVPVVANGVRAFATIWAANRISLERATGFDHIVYGWVFFGLVMAAVLAIGWRWFDRAPDAPAFDPATLLPPIEYRIALPVAAVLVLATAGVFPAWSQAIAGRAQRLPAHIDLPVVPGWHRVDISVDAPWEPNYPGADHHLFGRYADGRGRQVDMAVAVYGSQMRGHEMIAFGHGVLREEDRWVRVADLPDIDGGSVMRITAAGLDQHPVERIVATWYRIGNVTTNAPPLVKIEGMKARLFGGPQRAVAIHLSAQASVGQNPVAAIRAFRAVLGDIGAVADHDSGMR
ncbi:exosortase A [uncultured Sphingomonas sp.]|uniref:exosortase A n=1 Tax=uncultured Sphingomonas sp. TaxID=158754 RepID=UPI0035CB658F